MRAVADQGVAVTYWWLALLALALPGCAHDAAHRVGQTVAVGYSKEVGAGFDGEAQSLSGNSETYSLTVNPLAGLETDRERLERLRVVELEHQLDLPASKPLDEKTEKLVSTWTEVGIALIALIGIVTAYLGRHQIASAGRAIAGRTRGKEHRDEAT